MSSDPKPVWPIRAILLLFFGVPGAFCAAGGGAGLGAAVFGPERDSELLWIASLLFLISPILLLGGTCTIRKPLFLLVFLPMPVLMSAGYYLREYHHPGFWPVMPLGVAFPLIALPIISLHYMRRARRVEAASL